MKYVCKMCGYEFEEDKENTYDKGICCSFDNPFYIRTPKTEAQCEQCRKDHKEICNLYVNIDQTDNEHVYFLGCPECGSFILEKTRERVAPDFMNSLEKIKSEHSHFNERLEKAVDVVKNHIGNDEFIRLCDLMHHRFRALINLENHDPVIDEKYPTAINAIEEALRNTNNRVLKTSNDFGFEKEYYLYIAMMNVLHTIEEDTYITYKEEIDENKWTTHHINFKPKDAKKMN